MSLLRITDLRASLGGRSVLNGVSLAIGAGEFVGLIGPNGAGKTTLLRAILGLTASSGVIELDGRATSAMSARERARLVSYLPQEREIAWPVSVRRLVELGRAPHLPAFARVSAADVDAVDRAIQRMEIGAFANRPATELSGGEKARVVIARALAQEAPLMLADEPTAGLDPAHQISLMRVFSGLAQEGGSVVACLHDLGLAARWCTRLVLLDAGTIAADGAPGAVLSPDRLRDVYNIEAFIKEGAGGMIVHPLDLANR
ncbi:ABC transporter ATP-binding protein [Mesorhizobium sp. CAU 1741]|uniref:ABC transporter ATP-binding protein n=1 Tax=Mesorhizobium sp. CAU 1741 TaxID=3140366 RepID=UPI00325AB898